MRRGITLTAACVPDPGIVFVPIAGICCIQALECFRGALVGVNSGWAAFRERVTCLLIVALQCIARSKGPKRLLSN